MNDKVYLKLRSSEQAVFAAASRIFASHISNGTVTDENQQAIMAKAIRDAIALAQMADEAVASDGEMG